MTLVSRLKIAAVVLSITTVVASPFVWGETTGAKKPVGSLTPDVKLGGNFEVSNRFSKDPVLTYETNKGETLFAVQLKAKIAEAAPRPRDIVIMIDTSASQAGRFLATSRQIAKQVVADAKVNDRVSLWVINTPKATHSLTKELMPAKSPAVDAAIKSLKDEYPSGAVDLKDGLENAIKNFESRITRQQILLYVGDGESAYAKLSEKERYQLAGKLRAANVQVFAVPTGATINAQNIHCLTMGTGGLVVRIEDRDVKETEKTVAAMVERLNKAIETPVLMPTSYTLNAEAAETYPTRLPPLRSDIPVLLVGRFEKGKAPKELKVTIKGRQVGKDAEVSVIESVPAPGMEHFFLNGMVSQWSNSEMKDAPALLRSDRTLALAFEQGRLNRDEYLTQFNWALGVNQVDAAKNLVDAAASIDPSNPEVKAGLRIVELLKNGKLTIEQLKANPAVGQRVGVRYEKQADGTVIPVRANLEAVAFQDEPAPAPKANPPVGGADGQALLKAEAARRAVEEQKVRLAVEETMSRGRERLRDADPKTAKDLIVAQRDSVIGNPDISDATKAQLVSKMEALLKEIGTRGEFYVRQRALADEALAKARARSANINADVEREERTRERIRNFNSLMAQARFEEAYREALIMQQEKANSGQPVPVETQATYQMGQAATNLREMRELTRIREDRFLLTMMQVEKSHIPYPDEPPVHFPPSRVWRDLRDSRKAYSSTELGNDLPPSSKRRMEFLKSALETPVSIDVQEAPLPILLTTLEDLASPPGSDKDPGKKVKILLDEKAFKNETMGSFDLDKLAAIKLPPKLNVSLATVLRLITEQLDATYWVRRDYIEIVPAGMAIREKVIRVFPVEDLVIPIPKAVNVQALGMNLAVLGGSTAFAGQANMFGQIQGMFGGFGGQQGGNNGGGNVGQFFQGNRGGQVNLGAGGGVAGFGGGQLGQFGNLGGQFGFQGGDQSTLLVRLIQEVVAKGEWTNAPALLGGQAGAGGDPEGTEGGEGQRLDADQLNSLGYYPPALSLVIRGTSRIHRSQSSKLPLKKGMGDANFVPGVAKGTPDVVDQIAKVIDRKPVKVAKFTPKKELLDKDMSAEKIYQEVLAKGKTAPGEIIATVEFAIQCKEFKHASELLKAALRTGVVAEPWAQEALALSLESCQGSTEEIERAQLSGIDLEPRSPIAYLKAADAMTAMGNPDRGILFCKEAAKLEPNMPDPYMNALAFAGNQKATQDLGNDLWAAQNLLGHDWMFESNQYHLKAREHLKTLAGKFSAENKTEEAKKVQQLIESDKRRDLVIQLLWSGPADLDLKINEAIGTLCSSLNKQTTAGGMLVCDDFAQKEDSRSETYTAAQAFNGVYRIAVDRVWGTPLGNKATIKVIRHQGTPEQQVEIHTIVLGKENTISINFEGGRRTNVATIPPPAFTMTASNNPDRERDVIAKLRALTSTSRSPMQPAGGVGTATRPGIEGMVNSADNPVADLNVQRAINSSVPHGMDMRQQTTMTRDGYVRLSVSPVFQSVTVSGVAVRGGAMELIPGGSKD
jgi:tetratricopeptide (TPR) repeat protein